MRKRRLARIEQAVPDPDAAFVREQITSLVDFIERQPDADRFAFWRVNRQRYTPADRSPEALQVCGGVFALQPGDEATYRRLTAEFFGDDGRRPADEPDPAPEPAMA